MFNLNKDFIIQELLDRVDRLEESLKTLLPVVQATAIKTQMTEEVLQEYHVIPPNAINIKTAEIISAGNMKISIIR
jgi:hypothetical protein